MISRNTVSLADTRRIMGENCLDLYLTEEHMGPFVTGHRGYPLYIPFSREQLERSANTHILFPDLGLSIQELSDKLPGKMFADDDQYKLERFTRFMTKPQWRLVRKKPLQESFSKNRKEQLELFDGVIDELPSARELAYLMILHRLVMREWLLYEGVYVRTDDRDSIGKSVDIGCFKEDGIRIDFGDDNDTASYLGITTARKPDLFV